MAEPEDSFLTKLIDLASNSENTIESLGAILDIKPPSGMEWIDYVSIKAVVLAALWDILDTGGALSAEIKREILRKMSLKGLAKLVVVSTDTNFENN
jgi:hypothetical protein